MSTSNPFDPALLQEGYDDTGFDYSYRPKDKDGLRWVEIHHEGKVVTSWPARDSDTAIREAKEMIEWLEAT